MTRPQHPRAHELLADRALYGLDEAEARELRELGAETDESYDLAAAAVDVATLPVEPMPAAVAERLAAARQPRTVGWEMPATQPAAPPSIAPPSITPRSITSPSVTPPSITSPIGSPSIAPQRVTPLPGAPVPPITRRRRPLVSLLAAAATIAIVAGAWWLLGGRAPTPPPIAVTPAQARAELLASAADATRVDWQPTPEAANASGDVVWSPSSQRGYMRFVGLPANDPSKAQYQLWIFDRERDQAYPVDGGVFDVTSTGEVVIPITAKLRVGDATLFAVTIERPGGVVVSRREHIVVTAARS